MNSFPDRPVSAEEAVAAAEPYLDETHRLLVEQRGSDWPEREPRIEVRLKGRYDYVFKDDYPVKNAGYGMGHAVKVHSKTGDVIPPK